MYGEIIRRLRKEKSMTQKDLADILGFNSSSGLAMIEREERNISRDVLEKLSEIFGVSTDYILGKTSERYPGEIDALEMDVKGMYDKIKKMSVDDRKKLLEMIENFESENNK